MTPTQTVIPFKAKAEGVFVRVPERATGFEFSNGKTKMLKYYIPRGLQNGSIALSLPTLDKYEVVGPASDLTEFQWAEVVHDLRGAKYVGFLDYSDGRDQAYWLQTATESGLSLMRSLGITEGNWIVILKKQ